MTALQPGPDWYYSPTSTWVKVLRFLHFLEDDLVQISHTGIMMWITTANNLHSLLTSMDPVTVGGGIIANLGALVGHTIKRSQVINSKNGG